MSYIMGMDIGTSVRARGVDIDNDIFLRGIRDVLKGNKILLTEQEIRETVARFQKEMIESQQTLVEKSRKDAEAFVSGDKKREGIVVLPSGLQYKVIRAGTGRKPKPTDTVTVRYRATLPNGTEVDSSYRHGQPDTFQVNEMMPGLAEALPLMQEGARWLLSIPPELGYGERGAGRQIGPNVTVLFDVELVSIAEGK
jgi:FKBP-type peptidyl-prolyl cis-trans isomerase FklB